MKLKLLLSLLVAAIIGSIWAGARAQTIGCGNVIFGSLGFITPAVAQTIIIPCGSGGPPPVTCSGGGQLAFNSNCNTIFQANGTVAPL